MRQTAQAVPVKPRNRSASSNAVNGIAERLFMVAARLDDSGDRDRGRQEHKERWKT